MELAVDREQPIAHQADQVAKVAVAPDEVGGMGDGHVVVGLRTEHEHDVRVEQAQREHRSEPLICTEQQRQRVVGEAPRASHGKTRLARWEAD